MEGLHGAAAMAEMERRCLLEQLTAECGARYGPEIPAGVMAVLDDYMRLHQIKGAYIEDVETRGAVETVINGKQRFRRENKSVQMISKVASEQVKLLKAIGLISASKRGDGEAAEDEEDNDFDTF